MKKAVSFAITMVLMLALGTSALWAGGSKDTKRTGDGPVVIRVWGNDAHNKDQYTQVIEEFNKGAGAQQGIKIDYTVYGGDWLTALDVALASDEEPEIYKIFPKTQQYVGMGKVLPMKELPNFKETLDEFAPFQNSWTKMNGEVYALPLYQTPFAMAYNKDLLTRIGLSEPPKTWDEFEKACIAISKLEPGKVFGTGFPCKFFDFHDNYIMASAVPSIGHYAFDFAKGRYNFSDLIPYFEMIQRIAKGGGLFPGQETLDDDTIRAQFAEGKVGFLISGSYNVGVLYDQFPAKVEWGVAPVPVRDLNNRYNGVAHPSALFGVSPQAKEKGLLNQAAVVLKVIASQELRTLNYTYGKNIPVDPKIAREAPPSNRQQWNDFARISANFVLRPPAPDSIFTIEGDNYYTVFTQLVLGIANPASALADLDRRYNAALDRAVSNGTVKLNDYVDPSMTAKFKAGL